MNVTTMDAGEFPHPRELFAPLVLEARKRLRQQVDASLYNLLSSEAHAGWEKHLCERLYSTSAQAVAQQFQNYYSVRSAFASTRHDQQSSKGSAYADFVGKDPAKRLRTILGLYPGLPNVLEILINNWLGMVEEFLERLRADATKLPNHFAGGPFVSPVKKLQAGLSESHRGGRCVVRVEFAPSTSLIYKPRSLAPEARFSAFLKYLNVGDIPHALKRARCWDCGDYGWMEYITPQPCSEPTDLQAFYWRAGALLALIYLSYGVDMHRENLIADGADPVLIDLETLWHPQERIGANAHPTAATILRTGFLPQIGSPRGSHYEWNAFVRNTCSNRQASQHLPVLAGLSYPASSFLTDILAGFRWIGQCVFEDCRTASEFQLYVQALVRCRRRRILRSTSWYRSVIERMITPSSLQDTMSFTAECQNKGKSDPPLTEQERLALLQMDIPYVEQSTDESSDEEMELLVPDCASFERQEAIVIDALQEP